MDTKIAAALNNLNLNSQQKKIINEVLDNKFKYIDANSLSIKSQNINEQIFDFTFSIDDKGLNYNYSEFIDNETFTKYECTLKENELAFTASFDNDYFSTRIPYGISIKNNIYVNRTPNTFTLINNDAVIIYMGKIFASGNLSDLLSKLISIAIYLESRFIHIEANYVECKDFKVLDENDNAISVKDSIQDINNKINNNNNNINYITQNIQDITQNIQDINNKINIIEDDNGSDITQSFIDREIEELIYKTAEIRAKDTEYLTGEEFRELVISEKEYNKYNYTYDNVVHNNLHDAYDKIVVYKDILTKTINITNSNGEQEEINVLIVE